LEVPACQGSRKAAPVVRAERRETVVHSGLEPPKGALRDELTEGVVRRLRVLPSDLRPPFGWEHMRLLLVRRELDGARRSGGVAVHRMGLALAACAAALAVLAFLWSRPSTPDRAPPVAVRGDAAERPWAAVKPAGPGATSMDNGGSSTAVVPA